MTAAVLGAVLVLTYSGLMSSADAITKLLAGGYAAPQLYAVSGGLVVLMCLLADRLRAVPQGMHTGHPRAMALRAGATVVACTAFFYAFRLLAFAEVFVFIGLMPLFAGLMSGPILREHVRPSSWAALVIGGAGVLCLFPQGVQGLTFGHGAALLASVAGTFSIVMARYIGRHETGALAQVFWPNLAIFAVMSVVLPLVWRPMPLHDLALAAGYAVLLFGARWLLVVALRLLPAYAVTPLMNLQFVWMVLFGALLFGETPALHVVLGAVIVAGTGIWLVWDQARNVLMQNIKFAPKTFEIT